MTTALVILLISPWIGSLVNGLLWRPQTAKRSGVIATAAAAISFGAAVCLWLSLLQGNEPASLSMRWIEVGDLSLDMGFSFDRLTAVMALFVTGIGTLIHLYSIGYMEHDKSPARYFAYLNLFLANMLILITATSLPVLFVGWEGVGLCSYLLIGFWFEDAEKAAAGMKAFIVNRIGDAGFLIGTFLLLTTFHTVDFSQMAKLMAQPDILSLVDIPRLTLAAIFLFIGAMGKSAQIPLFVWLPDAMAGPTPVSALIHAATMVTAGIYLVLRMNFLYMVTPQASALIATMGTATALFGALVATSQRDIKKVLAYSTISQLGLIFMALGAGAYVAGLFHVVTHAFFKALLFLCAGSVIHALSGEQDIIKMGGLKRKLPLTFFAFTLGWAAICGLPPFSGFFSKDLILFSLIGEGGRRGWLLWGAASLTSVLTAFYMTRLYLLVFFGSPRGDHHPHESPSVMTVPLIVLGIGALIAGVLELPHLFHWTPLLSHFLDAILPAHQEGDGPVTELAAMGIATSGAVVAIGLAWLIYAKGKISEKTTNPLAIVLEGKFWIDEFYELVFVTPFRMVSGFLARVFDPKVVDGLFVGSARAARFGGTVLSFFQWGAVQFYLWVMAAGAVVLLWAFLRGWIFL